MSAPWPYEEQEPTVVASGPTWVCPGSTCQCNAPKETDKKSPFSVLLRDHNGEIMQGARCRLFIDGRLVNDDKPYADGDGRLRLELGHTPTMVRIEWAPSDTPIEPVYPYRKAYFADLREDSPREAARRRLHNLGFGHYGTLSENIKEFQREHGYPYVNGRLEDVEDDLTRYHDEGVLPSPPPRPPDSVPPQGQGEA